MNITFQYHCEGIRFSDVVDILKMVGMNYHSPETEEQAFNNSACVIFAFDGARLVGFLRAISDGEYQAALYDMAVHPGYQGKGIGKQLLGKVKDWFPGYNIILYATPGKEGFYRKSGFSRMLTGMALFEDAASKRENGFTD